MQIRILSITARDGGGEIILRTELCEDVFDVADSAVAHRTPERQFRELSLLADRYMELRPMKGVISEEEFRRLEEADRFTAAVRTGLRMLAFGSNTKRGLELKLCGRDISRETAQEAVAYLAARGYLSEEDDAVREAERGVAKLRGKNRICADLYRKGYDSKAVAAAEHYLDGIDFSEVCRRLIERRYRAQLLRADSDTLRKLAATLMRNGFTMKQIREAIRLCEEDSVV